MAAGRAASEHATRVELRHERQARGMPVDVLGGPRDLYAAQGGITHFASLGPHPRPQPVRLCIAAHASVAQAPHVDPAERPVTPPAREPTEAEVMAVYERRYQARVPSRAAMPGPTAADPGRARRAPRRRRKAVRGCVAQHRDPPPCRRAVAVALGGVPLALLEPDVPAKPPASARTAPRPGRADGRETGAARVDTSRLAPGDATLLAESALFDWQAPGPARPAAPSKAGASKAGASKAWASKAGRPAWQDDW